MKIGFKNILVAALLAITAAFAITTPTTAQAGVQFSVAVRNAGLDAIETTIGTAPKLYLRTGAKPSNCASADTGTLLATITLPSDWMSAASGGVKALLGTWADVGTTGGTVAHFRIKDSGGTTCHIQGSVTATGGGGDMTVDNTTVTVGQAVTITTFSLTAGNP